MAHEIGHVLGFNHPDTFVGANLVATAPMDASSCLSPLWHVALAEFAADSDSIMFSVSKHRARTCLTEDDVQGLHFLYPLCEGATSEPNCIKPRVTSGYLRLIISVAIPWLSMLKRPYRERCSSPHKPPRRVIFASWLLSILY